MDSYDDYQSFSPLPEPPSPEVHHRKLKRLRKKSVVKSPRNIPMPDPVGVFLPFPRVDFEELEAKEAAVIKTLDSIFDDSNESSDLLPFPRVDFAALEAEEAVITKKTLDSICDSNESSDPLPDSVDDLLPFPRVDFAALEAEEAAITKTKTLDSICDDDSNESSDPLLDSVDDLLIPFPRVDFAKLEAEEAAIARRLDSQIDNTNEPSDSQPESAEDLLPISRVDFAKLEAEEAKETKAFHVSNETESGFGEDQNDTENTLQFGDALERGHRETKRALEFDDLDKRKEKLKSERPEKKRIIDEEENMKKKKKTRNNSENVNDLKAKTPAPNKRKQEKERKAYLQQLHAESQRLLRETRDAAFKPVPVVSKPISSILEKIRKRKLEVSKKMMSSSASVAENNGYARDDVLDTEPEDASVEQKQDNSTKAVEVGSDVNQVDAKSASSLDVDDSNASSYDEFPTRMDCDEKPTPIFRPPIDDTQDLFGDSQATEKEAGWPVDELDSHVEEFTPSILAMNLKFDSVPSNDDSSEEDNDKENVEPLSDRREDDCTSLRGDPVKAFVDEEAEEEDDGDNDNLIFKDAEEYEDMEDSEELNDIIATAYEEKPVDNEMRNDLHKKWLEQQDAAGTDNLMQRLKVGSKLRETTPLGEEKDDSEDEEEEYKGVGEEDTELKYPTRINLKKAKEIIGQMFLDKDDMFLSDEDEETEKKIVKSRVLRSEGKAAVVSPADDESSREVFGLVKKLNIAPESRKKAKASSYFDSVLKGGAGKSFSKSSFLGRSSNHPVPSSNRKGSNTFRSFIFGRDDSNNRSSISTSDEPTDTISKENQQLRSVTTKYTSSQTKFSSSQYRKTGAETDSGTSLLEILKRSSEQPSVSIRKDPIDLTHVMDTFRLPKKPMKIHGRS